MPGAHFELAEALLLRGELARGWDEYEWRFRIAGHAPLMPPTDKPQWDGTPLRDRTLLLIADQGFGDVIQFSRYIPWAAERCPNIVIACSAEMMPLLRQVHPGMRAVPALGGRAAVSRRSAHCPACRVCIGTRLDTIPAPSPVSAAPTRRARRVGASGSRR